MKHHNRQAYGIRVEADKRHATGYGLEGFVVFAELVESAPDVYVWHFKFMTEFHLPPPPPGVKREAGTWVQTSIQITEETIDFLKWFSEQIDDMTRPPNPWLAPGNNIS